MKKIISIALAVVMLVACFSMTAFAETSGYYYQWDDHSEGAYFYCDFAQSGAKWEFDFMPLNGAEIRSYMGNEFVMNAAQQTIGVGNTTIRYNWNINQWYHIVVDGTSGSGSTITVDGVTIGTFATVCYARACCGMINVAVDNLVCSNGFSEDFNDMRVDGVDDANGRFMGNGDQPGPGPDEPVVLDGEGWMARIDEYGTVCKDIERYYENSPVTVEFDLILLPGENGAAPDFQIFESYEGSTRYQIKPNYIGGSFTFTEEEGGTSFNWGACDLSNQRHFAYKYNFDETWLYVDDQLVFHWGYGCGPAMTSIVVYMTCGSCLIDNVEYSRNGQAFYTCDFTQMPDNDNAQHVYVGDCTKTHVASNSWTLAPAPTCTEAGRAIQKCLICQQEAKGNDLAPLGHDFGKYADGKTAQAATTTTDGVKTWTCKRCSQVTATGVIPQKGSYTGTLNAFDTFDDFDVTTYVVGGFKNFYDQRADGSFTEDYEGELIKGEDNKFMNFYSGGNYHQFQDILTSGFSFTFDFRVNDLFETDLAEHQGHNFHVWFGGSSNIANMAGYDADNDVVYIQPEGGVTYDRVESDEIGANDGKWHTFAFVFETNTSTGYTKAVITLDGEEALVFDDLDASMNLPFPVGQVTFPLLFRVAGVNADFDNVVVGDKNFKWNTFPSPYFPEDSEPYLFGDLDGDGEITMKDSKIMKKCLQGTAEEGTYIFANGDYDNDGEITMKDSKQLKKILLGQD